MAEGIGQRTRAVAVELIFQRPEHRGPGGDGAVELGIDILDIDQKLTEVPSSDCGPFTFISGNSLASMIRDVPIRISA